MMSQDDCIFCQMLAGKSPMSLVYEDAGVVAFMDVHQPDLYKVLLVPRDHVPNIYDLLDEQAAQILQVAVKVSQAIRDVSQCDGLRVFQTNGIVAGQSVFHFHLHLHPLHQDKRSQKGNFPERDILDKLAADLRTRLDEMA